MLKEERKSGEPKFSRTEKQEEKNNLGAYLFLQMLFNDDPYTKPVCQGVLLDGHIGLKSHVLYFKYLFL